jgi:NAD(P)-dependent dehydrogenase (short-subunit alcohol dehydrogenase family)
MLELFQVNVIGSSFLLATFMPLVQAGDMKKVVVLSTGMGDPDFIAETEIDSQSPYAVSKAALNMVIAKYHAEYKKNDILIMGISPGIVETGWMDAQGMLFA